MVCVVLAIAIAIAVDGGVSFAEFRSER